MREHEGAFDHPVGGAESSGWDPAFAAFVLTHAGCGAGPVEERAGERLILAWCPRCAVIETFGSDGE